MKKKNLLKIKAAIFDMDGVITNTMPYHFDAWLQTFSSVGITVNCYDVYCREGQDGLSTVKEIFREHHKSLTLRQAKQLLLKKENLFKRIVKKRFVTGSRPFIRYLKKKGLLLALVTGTSRHEVKKILPPKLLALFDVSVTADEIKRSKPNPEPFLTTLKKLRIHSREAFVIENAPFGIKAAKRAKLFCVALQTSLPKDYLCGADIVLKSFVELKRLFSATA